MDVGILFAATIAAAATFGYGWWLTAIIVWVVGHFFLFCNVFRIARPLELTWGAIFVALGVATMALAVPGWLATFVLSLLSTIVVVAIEMRKPSYHGICWPAVNPRLHDWWVENREGSAVNVPVSSQLDNSLPPT
jgi:hypothetical protein